MSQTRFFKSVITPTLVQPTENHEAGVASGVWSLQDQARARRGGVWPEAGVANPDTLIENVFSTDLWTGDATNTTTIVNGIDLANDGGLIWFKNRSGSTANHYIFDTIRGDGKSLIPNDNSAEGSIQMDVFGGTVFNDDGFFLRTSTGSINGNGTDVVGWTFKKASKFFDIVTYTGNGSSAGDSQTITHNLGSIPGMIITKKTSGTSDWLVHHRSLSSDLKNLQLNKTDAESIIGDWNPTSTTFTVEHQTYASNTGNNENGQSYVAYLFGHDTSSDGMIQCGYYTGNGSGTGPVVDLGFEPQWVVIKNASSTGPWVVLDTMRGWPVTNDTTYTDHMLWWNTSDAEYTSVKRANPTSTGFQIRQNNSQVNTNGNTYVYMAIRRGPMATPTASSSVFDIQNSTTNNPAFTSDNIIDTAMFTSKGSSDNRYWSYRLKDKGYIYSNANNIQNSGQNAWDFGASQFGHYHNSGGLSGYIGYFWRRAPGFHDVVIYTGNDNARTITHNLGVAPEMMWIKGIDSTPQDWVVYYGDATDYLKLNKTDATADGDFAWNDTAPTSSVFSLGNGGIVNGSGKNFVAFLFATLAGVSKVGSVSHSGSSTDVDCGFSSGASLVMLKRTDSTGDWYWWDSTSGIVSGNDPYILLNTNAAQVTNTDLIDPLSSGFTITDDFTDGDYIFYAIAAI
jgi:hypothetical protein